ncbi:amino acid transporter [Aspergillus steynii IBT 23096]|uniref:Amino acid transporter n=1 Tax=Aspergillus steynii IBT 23096 TaxID=1392250 RepID=A0A2I2G4I7_9EURO|nr:amino acid transporter [Aspergillus steynii IBT 23096]PLB47794.1 amino acid transporter [Aspergillus steynii IBT 23096]
MTDQKKNDLDNLERNSSVSVGTAAELQKRFSSASIFAVCVTLMATWEAMGGSFSGGLVAGGLVALLYGYVLALVGTVAMCLSLAELASLCPTSAGQIHWAAILAPPRYAGLCSWLTGWITMLGWQAFTASAAFLGATMVQGCVTLRYESYRPERWHGTMIYWAILLLAFMVNTVGIRFLPLIEGVILIIHVISFLAVLVALVILAPHKNAEYVFTTFENNSGWQNDGVAWLIGLLSAAYVLVGYDGACHLSEEIHNASVTLPRVMIGTIALNSMLGLGFLFALLFCLGDTQSVLHSTTGFPIIQIFYNTTGSHGATAALMSPFICVAIASTFGLLASTSRTTWAFARDKGLPFSNYLACVNESTVLPLRAITSSTAFMALLGFINIGSTTAFNAIVSLSVVSLYISYLTPIFLHILRRITGPPLQYGPFVLEKVGALLNILSVVYSTVVVIFLFFPPYQPVTVENMNYACVVFGAVLVFSGGLWVFKGRKVYARGEGTGA